MPCQGRPIRYAGEIHALVGENGAGKSTLVKIMAGFHAPTAVELLHLDDGQSSSRPRDAINASIAVVYQEPSLVPMLTVEENLMLGQNRPNGSFGSSGRETMHEQALDRFGAIGANRPGDVGGEAVHCRAANGGDRQGPQPPPPDPPPR